MVCLIMSNLDPFALLIFIPLCDLVVNTVEIVVIYVIVHVFSFSLILH